MSSDFWSSLNFGQVTDRRMESDAYEPTVHMHRCAKKSLVEKEKLLKEQLFRGSTSVHLKTPTPRVIINIAGPPCYTQGPDNE